MEKFLKYLQEANEIISAADHLIYVTFPIVRDKRLLIKILLQAKSAVTNCINSVLQYEYLFKRIKLYQDPQSNMKVFLEKCSSNYGVTEKEKNLIGELFDLAERYHQSSFQFMKDEKVVILSGNSRPYAIPVEKVKEFIWMAKSILKKFQSKIVAGL